MELDKREAAQASMMTVSGESGLLQWHFTQGKAQYGSLCTVFLHRQSGCVVEVRGGPPHTPPRRCVSRRGRRRTTPLTARP